VRFLCRLRIDVRGGDGAAPAAPAQPFRLDAFNSDPAPGLAVPLIVEARYTAARDIVATDALDALVKVTTFANQTVPSLVPSGGRVSLMHADVTEWPA